MTLSREQVERIRDRDLTGMDEAHRSVRDLANTALGLMDERDDWKAKAESHKRGAESLMVQLVTAAARIAALEKALVGYPGSWDDTVLYAWEKSIRALLSEPIQEKADD